MSERLTADERRSAIAILVGAFSAFASIGALNVVVGKLVFDLTHREFDLGLLGLVEFTPGLILMLVSGTLADRIDRRRLASASLTAQAATVLGMAAYVATRPTSATPIFILMGVFGTTRALGNAARRSLPADTMPAPMLPWMTVRNSAALQVGQILGPVVAGVLYTAPGMRDRACEIGGRERETATA